MSICNFTDSAKRDLEDITDYSLKHWGKQQTIKYLDEIYEKTIALSYNPNIGILRADICPNILSFPIKKHVIYYIKQKQGIMVIRVLHTQMHLKIRNFQFPKLK
ncbi:type II toxin-antitoxin system RelE/ParE family toxin [Rickettsia endosymbiont of Halotydeus destructor]|uniref:type II toxin-antitoxin system RelE/ParE family toxin n=1 Tax=Rickettsia endosymbiont of Halotydeus destructor TaxID=2996754 RepID=UPI003BAF3B48